MEELLYPDGRGSAREDASRSNKRFQFDRLAPWEQEAVLKKQRDQERLRKSLESQVLAKKRASGDDDRVEGEISSKYETEQQSLESDHRSESLNQEGEHEEDSDHLKREGEDLSKLFPWKQEAILRKRKEQERTRRLLQEQIDQKKAAKEKKEEAEVVNDSPPIPAWTNHAEVEEKDNLLDTKSSKGSAEKINEEVAALRTQVEEQKQLLQEQAALMKQMQIHDTTMESFLSTASNSVPGTTRSRPKRERRPRRRETEESKFIRECELRRNDNGRFEIFIEPVLDTFCVIKRIGRSFVPDKRKILKPGDLIIALGPFGVRCARKALEGEDEASLDLETVMTTLELPSYEQIVNQLKKNTLINFAVCTASRQQIIDVAESIFERQEATEEVYEVEQDEDENLTESPSRVNSPQLQGESTFIPLA